jgi:hypothetical protein
MRVVSSRRGCTTAVELGILVAMFGLVTMLTGLGIHAHEERLSERA